MLKSPRRRGARRHRRATITAALLPICLIAAAPAAAVPVSVDLDYTCNFPLMAPQPLSLKISSDVPATMTQLDKAPRFEVKASAAVSEQSAKGLRALESVTIGGTATASARLTWPNGAFLPLAVPTTIEKTTLPATGGFTTAATGSTPQFTPEQVGVSKITIGDVVLTLTPRLADDTLTGLDTFETECFQVPGQNNLFASIDVLPRNNDTQPPTVPAGLAAVPSTTSIALSWTPSTDNVAVTGYDVYQGGALVKSVTGPSALIEGLTPKTAYKFTVRARDAKNNASAQSAELETATIGTGPAAGAYKTAGVVRIRTLARGDVPVSGELNSTITDAGDLTGDLLFNEATARLTALGFLPVTAKLGFISSGQTTGKFTGGVLTTSSRIRTKVQQVKLFGAIPLGGGNSCQSKSLSDVKLSSTGGAFTLEAGGKLNGSFAISDLNGCGALNGLVSPLTAGTGNTISLTLTPTAPASA